jgi:hypothetical protein
MKSFIICLAAMFITVAAFSQKAKQNALPANSDTSKQVIYTCSMHPDYINFAMSKCPVCGDNMSKKEVMKMEIVKIYNCPMDNVLSTKPGKCPKCGMEMTVYKPTDKSKTN